MYPIRCVLILFVLFDCSNSQKIKKKKELALKFTKVAYNISGMTMSNETKVYLERYKRTLKSAVFDYYVQQPVFRALVSDWLA